MSELKYLNEADIVDVRQTEQPTEGVTKCGYGGKIPSTWQLKIKKRDGRLQWYRVKVMVFGNAGTPYITKDGVKHLLGPIDPCYLLEKKESLKQRTFELQNGDGHVVMGPLTGDNVYITSYGSLIGDSTPPSELSVGEKTVMQYSLSGQKPTCYYVVRTA